MKTLGEMQRRNMAACALPDEASELKVSILRMNKKAGQQAPLLIYSGVLAGLPAKLPVAQ